MNTNGTMKNWELLSKITHDDDLLTATYKRKYAPKGYKEIVVTVRMVDLINHSEPAWFVVDTEATRNNGLTLCDFNPQCECVAPAPGVRFVVKDDYHPLAIEANVEKILKDVDVLIEEYNSTQTDTE